MNDDLNFDAMTTALDQNGLAMRKLFKQSSVLRDYAVSLGFTDVQAYDMSNDWFRHVLKGTFDAI